MMPITQDLYKTDRKKWNILWERNSNYEEIDGEKYEKCLICLNSMKDEPLIFDGPMNSDISSTCTHWACIDCWKQLWERGLHNCPFCRVSLCQWLEKFDDECECHCYDSDYDDNDTSDIEDADGTEINDN